MEFYCDCCHDVCVLRRLHIYETLLTHFSFFYSVGVIFALYMVCSLFYNYFVLQLRGFDLIPRYSFFSLSDTTEFFRGCMDRLRHRSSDSWHFSNGGMGSSWGHGQGGYRGLAASHEEGTSMLGGPPGFLDEQDEEDDEPETPRPGGTGMDRSGVIRL